MDAVAHHGGRKLKVADIVEFEKSRPMNGPIITTTEGKVQGTLAKSVYGPEYVSFTGIPYAAPPVGPLRFQAPQPPSKWNGIRDGSKQGPIPMHNSPLIKGLIGSEDCLTVNVYTNSIDTSRKKPVMFLIPGGAFFKATNHECINRHDYFAFRDIVLVTVNHRQGPLGFLNLGHKVASGNQGIRDIILALKWTRSNAEAFSGDPENITIFGNSSGSMLCHLLTLIPAAKGLFQKAILQSGLVFMMKDLLGRKSFKNGFRIAHLLGMDSDDPIEVVEFLRSIPAQKLIEVEPDILTQRELIVLRMYPYLPVYDANFSEDPLIPQPIGDLLRNGSHIPVIIGNTSDEFLIDCADKLDSDEFFGYYNDNIDEILRNMSIPLESHNAFSPIIRVIKEFYLKNEPISKENRWRLIRLFSDLLYIHWNRKLIDLRNQHAVAPTYHFNFSYLGNQETFYSDAGPQPLKGVSHADEVCYMAYHPYMSIRSGKEAHPAEGTQDRITSERLIRMWCNFAEYGNPTPQIDDTYLTTIWEPISTENLFYLDIGKDLVLKDDLESETRTIYEKIKDLYNV